MLQDVQDQGDVLPHLPLQPCQLPEENRSQSIEQSDRSVSAVCQQKVTSQRVSCLLIEQSDHHQQNRQITTCPMSNVNRNSQILTCQLSVKRRVRSLLVSYLCAD